MKWGRVLPDLFSVFGVLDVTHFPLASIRLSERPAIVHFTQNNRTPWKEVTDGMYATHHHIGTQVSRTPTPRTVTNMPETEKDLSRLPLR